MKPIIEQLKKYQESKNDDETGKMIRSIIAKSTTKTRTKANLNSSKLI